MPWLVSFVDPALDAPGFLLPLFRRDPGANIDLAQVVDQYDSVEGFLEITAPGGLLRHSNESLSIEVGDPALWAFKDHRGKIHVGAARDMATIASKLLMEKGLFAWPLVRLELGSFRDGQRPDAELMQAAFGSVRNDSGEIAAEVWRDTEIFAPAVRRDIQRHFRDSRKRPGTEQMVVLYRDRLNVFIEAAAMQRLEKVDWLETRSVLNAFGLSRSEIRVRRLGGVASSPKKRAAVWNIIGIGGVARHVLQDAYFDGRVYRSANGPADAGIQATGSLSPLSDQASPASHFIAVCQSVAGQVEIMAREVESFPPEAFVRHLVNVRPFNFGSPPPRKTSVNQLPTLARGFDHAWIIAGHRQRRTGRFRNQFSVTNAASRHVRTLLKSLIRRADLAAQITREGLSKIPSLNLFGMLRPRAEWSEQDTLRNLLHTMLCEEALLHTSERIIVLKPDELRPRMTEVRLGRHRYVLQLVTDARTNRSTDLIGWAISADLPKDANEAFKDFCIGLLDGYRWDYRGPDGDALLFEDEGEAIRVWPAQSSATVLQLISRPAAYGRQGDIILTPQSTSADLLRRAAEMEWTLLHYSELPHWIRDHYRSGRFGDSENQ
jgi:hypothetical protein